MLEAVINARAKAPRRSRCRCRPTSSPIRKPSRNSRRRRRSSTGALGRLIAVSENYPDLKSNQNFLALQSQLEGTENRIAVARRDYIEAVRAYNTELRTFPGVIWATDPLPQQQADGDVHDPDEMTKPPR